MLIKDDIIDMALTRIGEPEVAGEATSRRAVLAELHYAQTLQELLRAHRWNFAITRTLLQPEWLVPWDVGNNGAGQFRIYTDDQNLETGHRILVRPSVHYPAIGGMWRVTAFDDTGCDLDDSVFSGSGAFDVSWTHAGTTEWTYSIAAPADMLRALEDNRAEDTTFTQWVLESGRILTNCESLPFSYVRNESDPVIYGKDPLFVAVLILRLAIKLKVALRGEGTDTGGLQRELENLTAPLAKRVDANEGQSRERLLPRQSLFVAARGRG